MIGNGLLGRGKGRELGGGTQRKAGVVGRKLTHVAKSSSIGSLTLPPLHRLRLSLSPKVTASPPTHKSPFALSPERPSLANYRLLRTIGTGSFSRVRLAVHRTTQEISAIKIFLKQDIVRKRQVEHVRSERHILGEVHHPFIAGLQTAFQDRERLYLVQDYVPGGELYRVLRGKGRLAPWEAQFYVCEVAAALVYLHGKKVVYRDVKPENILISETGHVRLVDFGFAKQLFGSEKTFTLCGTPEYIAPEVIQQRGHDSSCDWWALGILLYELLTGHAPFLDPNPFKLYEKILTAPVTFPADFNETAKALVAGLTEKLPVRRLQQRMVLKHQFFSGVDWEGVDRQEQRPPFVPSLRGPEDAGNFEVYEEEGEAGEKVTVTFDMFPNF